MPTCPECTAGKHTNCDGTAWDLERDTQTPCTCPDLNHTQGSTAMTDTTTTAAVPAASPVQILVLQRGWVVIGRVTQDGDTITVADASVIRRWGTDDGLGELRGGPTPKTVLDPAGTVRCHVLTVVLSMDVDEAAWTERL